MFLVEVEDDHDYNISSSGVTQIWIVHLFSTQVLMSGICEVVMREMEIFFFVEKLIFISDVNKLRFFIKTSRSSSGKQESVIHAVRK